MATSGSKFEAKGGTLGYLFQLRCALLLFLRRVRRDPTCSAAIETLDDVLFEIGDALEVVETKHHVKSTASLTDRSVDFWKSVRIWCDLLRSGKVALDRTDFLLITTATATPTSIAALLRTAARNVPVAVERMETVAETNQNEDLVSAAAAFLNLMPEERTALVSSIYVLDQFPAIADVQKELLAEIAFSVDMKYREPFLDRLQGWFLRRAVQQLQAESDARIKGEELVLVLDELRFQFRRDNLPIDFLLAEPEAGISVDEDTRCFVHQLRLIAISNKRIENAIKDYYRAYEQVSRWVREDLLHVGELRNYEAVLVEEWERYRDVVLDEAKPSNDDEQVECGKRLFRWVEMEADLRIRPECQPGFVMRGSYHLLSDAQRVGWHPEFIERLKQLLKDAS